MLLVLFSEITLNISIDKIARDYMIMNTNIIKLFMQAVHKYKY
jgi:hypothetical protein